MVYRRPFDCKARSRLRRALLSKHLTGVTDLLLAFDHPRKSLIIQRHIGEIAIGYEDAIRLVSPDHPSLDVHGDRRLSNAD